MTERLYYDDSYLKEFSATVLEARPRAGEFEARLDRSAFYPTSGGQPYDTGALGGARVTDVYVSADGEVWHVTDGPLEVGASVVGKIDWKRRFDHMQQHGGEHMLAGCVYELLGGVTEGLHLGTDFSTIDVELPGGDTHISPEDARTLEIMVNERVQSDAAVRCFFPDAEELARLPLRKPPTVRKHVRVVAFGDFEMVACGGTHPSTAGQIGAIKIIDARPSKGKVRIAFVCGMRAVRDYQSCAAEASGAAALLSSARGDLDKSVRALMARESELRRALADAEKRLALQNVSKLQSSARAIRGASVVSARLPQLPIEALREVANALTSAGNTAALLACGRDGGGLLALFARSNDCALDMGKLLKRASAECGGKGGGKPDFAQGSAATEDILRIAERLIEEGAI